MTPVAERVNLLRALQAELAKTIMQLEPVASARIHIVLPDTSPFVRDQKPTTASVLLRLKPGTTLNRNVAHGIVALVARSVEGLNPENVTLLDGNGRVLSESADPDVGMADSHLEMRRQFEANLATKAEEMLTKWLGPNRAVVRVSADINFQRTKEKKETYTPDGRVIVTEKVTSSKSSTPVPGARGPAGVASNVPGRPASTGANPLGTSNDETTETAYAVSKVIQEMEDKVGTVERLTIAALVDLPKGENGAPTPGMTVPDLQKIIETAVGFKTGRDEIKVTDVKLTGTPEPNVNDGEWEKIQLWQNVANIVRNGSLGIAALVGLVLGWMVFRRLRPAPAPPPAAPVEWSAASKRLAALAQSNPTVIAQALTSWLERTT